MSNVESSLLIRRLTAVVLLVLMVISTPLWLTYRDFPIAPVFYSLPILPGWLSIAIYVLLLVLLILTTFARKASPFILTFCLLFWGYSLFDYSRIQVYYIEFSIMLAGFGLLEYLSDKGKRAESVEIMNGIRLFFVFCYFYSGLYKMNGAFFDEVIPWFIQPFTKALGISVVPGWVGMFIALTEILGGLLLFIPKLRRIGVLLVILIHLFILGCIGPIGHNWNMITWPWNIFMALFSYMLFWKFNASIWGEWKPSVSTQFKLFIIVFAGFLPMLFGKGKWDSFFSFDLYSGKTKLAVIYLSEPEIAQLPAAIQEYISLPPTGKGRRYLDLTQWGFGELHTLPYPEVRAFHKMHTSFSERFYHNKSVGSLVIYSHYDIWRAEQQKN